MFQAKGVVCRNCAPIYRRKSNTAVVGRSDMKIEYSEKSEQRCRSSNVKVRTYMKLKRLSFYTSNDVHVGW